MSFLLRCQKPMLIMAKAIPIGIKTPMLPPTKATIMKSSPLIKKSVAAVLYDFKYLGDLLLILKIFYLILGVTLSLFDVTEAIRPYNVGLTKHHQT